MKCGPLEWLLGLAGTASLVLGGSFVKGAMEENEPKAAEMGAKLFGGLGLGLLGLSFILSLVRKK